MFVLVLWGWELRTFMRAFVLLFGVAGKCSLILLLCRQDFRVDLVCLNGTETISLLFFLCFLTLSVDDSFIDGVLLSLISEFFSFRFRFLSFNFIPCSFCQLNFLFEACVILLLLCFSFSCFIFSCFSFNSEVLVLYLSLFFCNFSFSFSLFLCHFFMCSADVVGFPLEKSLNPLQEIYGSTKGDFQG